MGQGFSLATPTAGAAGIDVPELSDLLYEKSVGNARFMKSIRARHHDGVVLVKVLVKPYTPLSLDEYKQQLIQQRKALADVPNVLTFQRIIETETNGYLVRQFQYNSLYDRMSTRPFLEEIEKKWLAFQLLSGLRDCHARDVYHGDIKSENTLVTSWNWLYLTDFSSPIKPVLLPDDNPGDFSFFFDTSGRRTCYIAPERFVPAEELNRRGRNASLTWAMDVFSAGCVIAEMFLEAPIFTLSQLYKYRKGEYDPAISQISRIPDKDVREMIFHMVQLDPERRYSAEQYLDFWKKKVFPEYFYNFLHQYMELVTDPSSGNKPVSGSSRNLGEADDRIDLVFSDFDKISYFLGNQGDIQPSRIEPVSPHLGLGHFPVHLNIPNHERYITGAKVPPKNDGNLLFLTLVVSSIRSTARASSRIRACDILLAFAERLPDAAKLDRVLPYLMLLLTDKSDPVAIAAARSVTQLLQLVEAVTPVNAHIFIEYVLPRFQSAFLSGTRQRSPLVRATYASCLGSLATTATRYLEMAATLKANGALTIADPEIESGKDAELLAEGLFDDAQRELYSMMEHHTKALVEAPDAAVRRAFLTSVPELCVFFGPVAANDILLTHLNTYLNDKDWMLKCAFFDTIVAIGALVGSVSLEEFIFPLMIPALTDTEEFVVQTALHCLAQLAALGLFSRAKLWELIDLVSRFTVHPNIWIREAAAEFLSSSAKYLSTADIIGVVLPLVQPYLKESRVPDFAELELLDTLKRPLSRSVFEQALNWALKTEKGTFWKYAQQHRVLPAAALPGSRASRESGILSLKQIPRNDEDEQWLSRLRNLGLGPEDEFKLVALREFIWRISRMKGRDAANGEIAKPNEVVSLKSLGITPQTIFFFEDEAGPPPLPGSQADAQGPYTIADALLDASMTIDESSGKRRLAALNSLRTKVVEGRSREVSRTRPVDNRKRGSGSQGGLLTAGSPVDDDSSARDQPYASRRLIRHQVSALSLLDRKDSNKSVPETSMSGTNAFGEVEGPFSQSPHPTGAADGQTGSANDGTKPKPSHSYEGSDPSIIKMLDTMYVDNYPRDIADFGPLVTPVSRRKANRAASTGNDEPWRPNGRLVATFAEHAGAINRLVVSPDHLFFITGGDDGTVRVWDSARLEKNITNRSRQTHRHAQGAKVVALCFVENTHTFVSCATDGAVQVVKVEAVVASGVMRYGKLRVMREYQLPEGEYAVWCEHFRQESASTLVLATNRSRIVGIDLRVMTVLFDLENPVHHGTPTCFCVDRKRNWLCLGTSHGVLDLWDLRFKLRLKGWGVPGKSAIYRLSVHPTKGRGKYVCVAGGTGQGEVTVWDLERTMCREIYRVGGNKEGPKGYEAWDVDEDKPEGMLGRYATNIEPSGTASTDRGVRAMVAGTGATDDSRDIRHAFIVTGGSDKKLRFWDLSRIENSVVYSGLGPGDARPTFTASHPTTTMTLNTERVPRASTAPAAGGQSGGRGKNAAAPASNGGSRSSRSTVISIQQQQLLREHLDSITDVALLEMPYSMTVSVDRSGVAFVFS